MNIGSQSIGVVLIACVWASSAIAVDPPHHAAMSIDCSSCHTIHAAPGGTLTAVAGNANLCESCHLPGGLASAKPFVEVDQALPGPGLPVGTAASGNSHRWDSGPAGHVQPDAGNTSTGTVQSTGVFNGRYAKTYTITIATAGDVSAATFDWTDTQGNGAIDVLTGPNVLLDEGVNATFVDGAVPPSFDVGDSWHIYVRTEITDPADPNMILRLADGKIICSTCHNQHSQAMTPFDPAAPAYAGSGTGDGRHFQRIDNDSGQMCAECHGARDVMLSSMGSHPVGVAIPATVGYQSPTSAPLDAAAQVQCQSCHAIHYAPTSDGSLVRIADMVALCTDCHSLAGAGASHQDAIDGVLWPGGQYGSTFPANTSSGERGWCTNCHQPHGWPDDAAPTQDYAMLLVDHEEDLCHTCHDGNPGGKDIMSEFAKASVHPITMASGTHQIGESAIVDSPDRHVECVDCHNSHQASASLGVPGPATTPRPASGPLAGVPGVDLSGAGVAVAAYEYEVCSRCHADSTGMPAAPTSRQFPETNVRAEFNGSMTSFHAVAVTGTPNPNVPSLTAGWSSASILACTSCHNNDALSGGGSGSLSYLDEFQSTTYDGSDGSEDWTPTPWVENDDGGGGAGGGNIRVRSDNECTSGNCLRIEAKKTGDDIVREADLSGASSASFIYDYEHDNRDGSVTVEVSGNGGGSWTALRTYGTGNNGSGSESFDITPYIASNTQIRFRVTDNRDLRLWIDSAEIAFTAGGGGGSVATIGPHGSAWPTLLERRFDTSDPSTYSQQKYDLCFKCHSATSIMSDASFTEHDKHIRGEDTSCSVCHDPHASASQRFLINFDVSVVSPAMMGQLEFIAPQDSGNGRGQCFLTCHGKKHNPLEYNPNY